MTTDSASREKHAAALSSVLAALLLTGMKAVVGWLTGSLGILAEAAHSALDLGAAAVTLLAVKLSGRPADRDHTYGHGKIENLSALIETLLLLATCVWIIKEAFERLFIKRIEVEPTVAAFLVMLISILVDYSRSSMLIRAARKHDSQALEADALHFSTDIWSSAVVVVGLAFVALARWRGIPWLADADAIAALGVSAIVIWVSVQLGRRAVTALLDGVPPGLRDELERAVHVPGVIDVRRVRVRRSGADTFADIVLTVDRQTSLEESHAIADRAEEALRLILPRADASVHVEPSDALDDSALAGVRSVARDHGLAAHDIRIVDVMGCRSLEMHLEIDGRTDVSTAHARATAFEEALKSALPSIGRIVTHLEPPDAPDVPCQGLDEGEIARVVAEVARGQELECQPHDLAVSHVAGQTSVAFHCAVSGQASLAAAHRVTEEMERAIRQRLPLLQRVTIHVEPDDREYP
jgi:cation diffusion facilitator family transporter